MGDRESGGDGVWKIGRVEGMEGGRTRRVNLVLKGACLACVYRCYTVPPSLPLTFPSFCPLHSPSIPLQSPSSPVPSTLFTPSSVPSALPLARVPLPPIHLNPLFLPPLPCLSSISICLSIHLFIYLPVYLSICVSVCHL